MPDRYDEPARVPFIIRPPGGAAEPRYDRQALVSAMLDVMPTLLDYVGIELPGALNGFSVRPVVENPQSDHRHEFVVAETSFGTAKGDYGVHGRMVRTERYKYIVYNKGDHREQLFDMRDDPGELVDLTQAPAHEPILDNHRRLLRQWMEKTDDQPVAHWGAR